MDVGNPIMAELIVIITCRIPTNGYRPKVTSDRPLNFEISQEKNRRGDGSEDDDDDLCVVYKLIISNAARDRREGRLIGVTRPHLPPFKPDVYNYFLLTFSVLAYGIPCRVPCSR
ncbi:hypothetical protein HHI36_017379 [Cryptolaemus montrouzieri]|uniref:Uncharacterized protein n=1 Tax=Cryptolaemus montrouzieri TaxID=559131 RepID=A0ABD2NMB1_9CUCU